MDTIGIGIISAPRRYKPITVVRCALAGSALTVIGFDDLYEFLSLELNLEGESAWIAVVDFLFGQS
ncbi:hypothetical protein OAJ57_00015 [Alphaproteobacteria bacterium]|nr:hypothetical protein [Alphaproteobacteria bacterium]